MHGATLRERLVRFIEDFRFCLAIPLDFGSTMRAAWLCGFVKSVTTGLYPSYKALVKVQGRSKAQTVWGPGIGGERPL